MDSVSIVMFAFVLVFGFIFTILGFFEFKDTVKEKEKHSPFMGLIYFLLSSGIWLSQFFFWYVMATDPLLQIYSWFWFALFWVGFALSMACLGYILKGSVEKDAGPLSIKFGSGSS